jgi:hypothetical protein
MKWMSLILLSGFLAMGCQNSGDSTGDAGGDKTPVADDLPKPADETAELLLDGVRHTLPVKLDCKNGGVGIAFKKTATTNPTLNLHDVDLAATGSITVKTGGVTPAWSLDLDDTYTWGTVAAGCPATVVENTATMFELKAIGCNLKDQNGTTTGKASFRLRCTKGS